MWSVLARLLGWLGIALGIAEVIAPRRTAALMGTLGRSRRGSRRDTRRSRLLGSIAAIAMVAALDMLTAWVFRQRRRARFFDRAASPSPP